eukprot:14234940-Alexandrium_andersonii.AAC.1
MSASGSWQSNLHISRERSSSPNTQRNVHRSHAPSDMVIFRRAAPSRYRPQHNNRPRTGRLAAQAACPALRPL